MIDSNVVRVNSFLKMHNILLFCSFFFLIIILIIQ